MKIAVLSQSGPCMAAFTSLVAWACPQLSDILLFGCSL
jgi:hypothetical protein